MSGMILVDFIGGMLELGYIVFYEVLEIKICEEYIII